MLLLFSSLAAADPAPELLEALEAELDRAMSLELADEPTPWWVQLEVLDGGYYTAFAEFGALLNDDENDFRALRADVRAGTAEFDSANFDSFGEPDGVVQRGIPVEDDVVAIQRELWLATDLAYKQALEQLARKEAELEGQDDDTPTIWTAEPVVDLSASASPVQVEAVRSRVVAVSEVLTEYPQFESGAAAGRDWQGLRVMVNSEGSRLAQPTGFAVVRVEAIVRTEDGTRLRNGRWWVADTADELPSVEEMEAETREMADWLVEASQARVVKEYLGPVLFEQEASVEVFRQLVASETIGTPPAATGRGIFGEIVDKRPAARVGRRLLPEGWTVVDDPTADAVGSYLYDQEGVPGQRVVLVEDGVVRKVLQSRVPSSPDGASTGHGRSVGSERREAQPSIVEVRSKRRRSMRAMERKGLRMAEQAGAEGLLVVKLLEPPAMSEDFEVFFTGDAPPAGLTMPYEAYLLHPDGTREAVRGLRFSGVDRRALRDIVAAGETGDFVGVLDGRPGPARFHIGAVGGMPGAWAAPPVLIAEMELVGNHGGDPRQIPRPTADAAETE